MSLSRIPGVELIQLAPHRDARGSVTEVFRDSWQLGCGPKQWNADISRPRTLRGVHAHRRRHDYATLLRGRMMLALHDARRDSATFGETVAAEVSAEDAIAVVLPPGVAHGLYYIDDCVTLIGFSVGWDASDDVRCHHAAPELGMTWPGAIEHISDADASAPGYAEFLRALDGA